MHTPLILDCIRLGILTESPLRKYPLRAANLAVVLKAYAIEAKLPYTLNNQKFDELSDYKLYLTDAGLEWLFNVFKQHSLPFLRSAFQFVFSNATEADIQNPEYVGYNNFRGITGDRPKAGTKQKAVLVRKVGRTLREYKFDSIREARREFLYLSRFYPVEQFKLYRIKKNTKKGKVSYYRDEIPLILKESKRGVPVNLPHLKEGGNR
jgi:hypothetical protein